MSIDQVWDNWVGAQSPAEFLENCRSGPSLAEFRDYVDEMSGGDESPAERQRIAEALREYALESARDWVVGYVTAAIMDNAAEEWRAINTASAQAVAEYAGEACDILIDDEQAAEILARCRVESFNVRKGEP
jgi:hypothetical protein